MSGLYRVLDPDFYRARAESRARARAHMRRKAVLRFLLSREVRIGISVMLAGLVLLAYSFAAPRDGALRSPSARGLDFPSGPERGRLGTLPWTRTDSRPQVKRGVGVSGERLGDDPIAENGVTAGRDRPFSIRAQTLDGTPAPPGERTPVQSAKLFLAAQALLFLSLALGCFLVLYGFRLAREAERESEGKVTDGWLRRNR